MGHFVYVIRNQSSRFYVGMTSDLSARLQRHNADECRTTRLLGPWQFLHTEEVADRKTARLREKFFKSGVGRQLIKQMLGGM